MVESAILDQNYEEDLFLICFSLKSFYLTTTTLDWLHYMVTLLRDQAPNMPNNSKNYKLKGILKKKYA